MSSPEVQCTTIIINRDVPDPALGLNEVDIIKLNPTSRI